MGSRGTDKNKQWLKMLTQSVDDFLDGIDEEMKKPSTNVRGRAIAKLCNSLNMDNDRAKHFGLDIPLEKC